MIRFGRLLCLLLAGGGFAAAHVLVQPGQAMDAPTVSVPTLPITTAVPAPSLPAPTVPAPSTPTTTAPAPPPVAIPAPPPVRLPPVTTSLPPTAPSPAPKSAQPTTRSVTVDPLPPPPRTSTPPSRRSDEPTASTRPRSAAGRADTTPSTARARAIEATTHRARHRVSVRLAFRLPHARRIFLVVRGPAPTCRIAGFIPVRGRKGANTVLFAGRVHGRRLVPGVYLISISPTRSPVPGAATEYVRVVSPRRSVPLPDSARKPSCKLAAASTPGAIRSFAPADPLPRVPTARPTARLAGTATTGSTGTENDDGAAGLPDSGVLGATTEDATGHAFVAIALLALVGALLLAMLALVTRFLRGNWNP